jgi:hypothetical protein
LAGLCNFQEIALKITVMHQKLINIAQKSLAALFIVSQIYTASAQEKAPKIVCATDQYMQQAHSQMPQLLKIQRNMDAGADAISASAFKSDDTSVIVIPVVFHVIYNSSAENISKASIVNQMQTLNETFRAKNKDISNVSEQFKSLVADCRIEFRLATKDPWGRCTDGIDRVQSDLTVNATDQVKAVSWWDSRMYLNIWVVENVGIKVSGGIVAGYSKFPWDAANDPANDGIIMDYHFIGKNQKVLTHEVGHYLGLYHTFQDGCTDDERVQGDHVFDTPAASEANYGCPKNLNSCEKGDNDLPDMIENFMDYTDCRYMFTEKQKVRARWFLGNPRGKLWSADNLAYTLAPCSGALGLADENTDESKIEIYPNPAHATFRLKISSANVQYKTMEIRDVMGRIVSSKPLPIYSGDLTLGFTCAELGLAKAGIYFVQLQSAQQTKLIKLRVE